MAPRRRRPTLSRLLVARQCGADGNRHDLAAIGSAGYLRKVAGSRHLAVIASRRRSNPEQRLRNGEIRLDCFDGCAVSQ
jgi:hypothetical protein